MSTSYLRNRLLQAILDKQVTINTDMCQCIYQVTYDARTASRQLSTVLKGKTQPCSYATTLANLGMPLHYLGHGVYGVVGKVCTDITCRFQYAIKMIPYHTIEIFGSTDNPKRPENLEVTIIRRLNQQLLYPKITPHITCYIQNVQCDGIIALWDKGTYSDYDAFVGLGTLTEFTERKYQNSAQVLIVEFCEQGDLTRVIKHHLDTDTMTPDLMSVLYFQMVYTLAHIQRIIPNFRHNDCTTNNWLVQTDENYDAAHERFYAYHFDKRVYLIPVIPYQLKLWDFGMSNITGEMENLEIKVMENNNFGYRNTPNQSYDLHHLTNILLTYFTQLIRVFGWDHGLIVLWRHVVPRNFRGHRSHNTYQFRLVPNIELVTPHTILTTDNYLTQSFAVDPSRLQSISVVESFGETK